MGNHLMRGLRRMLALTLCAGLSISLAACGEAKDEGPDYADDEAMSIIAKGFEKRSDKIDSLTAQGEDTSSGKALQEFIQTEIDNDSSLKDRQFENSKMQEDVVSYINLLNDQKEAAMTRFSENGSEKWQKAYDERSSILKKFVEEYGLKVGDNYKGSLEEIVANGNEVTEKNDQDKAINGLISAATFEKVPDGYGSFTYTATIQNTTNYNFTDVGLILALYDANNVKAEETYASTNSWNKGETVKFEALSNTDAATVKASVKYYDVAN